MNSLDKVAYVLVLVGGLNWGLVGALEYNLVDSLLGAGSMWARTVYVLVGLAALYSSYSMMKMADKK